MRTVRNSLLVALALAASSAAAGEANLAENVASTLVSNPVRSAQYKHALSSDALVEAVRQNLSSYSFSVKHSSASGLPVDVAAEYVSSVMRENKVSGALRSRGTCAKAGQLTESVDDLSCVDSDTLRYFWMVCVPSDPAEAAVDIVYGTGLFAHTELSSEFCRHAPKSQSVQRVLPAWNATDAFRALIVSDENSWTNHSVLVAMDILQYQTAREIDSVQLPTNNGEVLVLEAPAPAKGASSLLQNMNELKVAVDGFVSSWKGICDAFKTIKSTTITKVVQNGFKDYAQHSKVSKTVGLPSQYQVEYAKSIITDYKFPAHYKSFVMGIEYASDYTWEAMDGVYKDGSYKVKSVVKNGDLSTMMASYLVVDLEIDFDISDDLLDIVTHKSVAGGIFDKTSEKYQSVPHDLTVDDLEKLMNFFRLVQMQAVSDVLNAKILAVAQ